MLYRVTTLKFVAVPRDIYHGLDVTDTARCLRAGKASRFAIVLDRPWTVHWPILLLWVPFEVRNGLLKSARVREK